MEAIPILAFFGVFCASSFIVGLAVYRLMRHRKISPVLGVLSAIAAFSLAAITIDWVGEGDIEHNPQISSSEPLTGTYSSGDRAIVLRADGTYSSTGIAELTSGTWGNRDWNLTLSNSGLREPRIIARNKVLCIAPFYDGVDAPLGTLVKKEDKSGTR